MLQIRKVLHQRLLSTIINSYKDRINTKISNIQQRFVFPEKLKGTIFERWKDYWVNLLHDYADVAKETVKTAKTERKKTAAIFSVFAFGAYCFKTNPDESSYRDAIIWYSTELIMTGPTIRNPNAKRYLEEIESYYNQGVLNKISFGLFSLILKDNYNEYVGLYKAQCPYLNVPFYRYYEKIVDVGFMNKWHVLDKKMKDYDINPEEWQ